MYKNIESLCCIHETKKKNLGNKASRVVKIMETETVVMLGAGEGEMGSCCSVSIEFQVVFFF